MMMQRKTWIRALALSAWLLPLAGGGQAQPVTTRGPFPVIVVPKEPGGPDALSVFKGMQNVTAIPGQRLTVPIPVDVFSHTNREALVSVTVSQSSGEALPYWVIFQSQPGALLVHARGNERHLTEVRLRVRDNLGRQAITVFRVIVPAPARP